MSRRMIYCMTDAERSQHPPQMPLVQDAAGLRPAAFQGGLCLFALPAQAGTSQPRLPLQHWGVKAPRRGCVSC